MVGSGLVTDAPTLPAIAVADNLALLVRGPFGLTFMGRVDHSYTKPLKASIMLAKVF